MRSVSPSHIAKECEREEILVPKKQLRRFMTKDVASSPHANEAVLEILPSSFRQKSRASGLPLSIACLSLLLGGSMRAALTRDAGGLFRDPKRPEMENNARCCKAVRICQALVSCLRLSPYAPVGPEELCLGALSVIGGGVADQLLRSCLADAVVSASVAMFCSQSLCLEVPGQSHNRGIVEWRDHSPSAKIAA